MLLQEKSSLFILLLKLKRYNLVKIQEWPDYSRTYLNKKEYI